VSVVATLVERLRVGGSHRRQVIQLAPVVGCRTRWTLRTIYAACSSRSYRGNCSEPVATGRRSTAIGVAKLNQSNAAGLLLPIPPLDVQQRILAAARRAIAAGEEISILEAEGGAP